MLRAPRRWDWSTRARPVADVAMSVCLRSPIVLAHGLFGFKQIGLGPLTVSSYFRGIPEWLEAAGNRGIGTQVPAVAGSAQRAKRLGEQIDAAFPDEPVH